MMRIFLFMAMIVTGWPLPGFGEQTPNVMVTLSAVRIVNNAHGKESLLPGERANPGDSIEYRATYKNIGTAPAQKLTGTLPVPAEMEYVPSSAHPSAVMASTDNTVYSKTPLKRKVKLANGTLVNREVPVEEYRSLRWLLHDLAPGASVTVSARMKIKDNQKGPVVIKLDSISPTEKRASGGTK